MSINLLKKMILASIVLIGILFLIVNIGYCSNYSEKISKLEVDNNSLQSSIYNVEDKNDNISESIGILKNKKKNLENELNQTQLRIEKKEKNISGKKNDLDVLNESLEQNLSIIRIYENGTSYELHDPTFSEMIDFMQSDKTNQKEYVEDVYECRHFAQEVNNNSEMQGIRCAYVGVSLNGPADHAIVAFNTTDNGLVFYEPQSDKRVNLQIGEDYWAECIVGGYYASDPENEVQDYTLYW